MDREVAFRQPGLALEIEEIGALHGSQDGQDDTAGGLVDETVYVGEGAQVSAHRAVFQLVEYDSGKIGKPARLR